MRTPPSIIEAQRILRQLVLRVNGQLVEPNSDASFDIPPIAMTNTGLATMLDDVLVAGANVTLVPGSNTITISAVGGGGGTELDADGLLALLGELDGVTAEVNDDLLDLTVTVPPGGVLKAPAGDAYDTDETSGLPIVPEYTPTPFDDDQFTVDPGTGVVSINSLDVKSNNRDASGALVANDTFQVVNGSDMLIEAGPSAKVTSTAGSRKIMVDANHLQVWQYAITDRTTDITTGTKLVVRAPHGLTIKAVRASLETASSSGTPTFNVLKNGTTIFSTKVTIDATERTSVTAATASVLSTTSIADDDELTFTVDTSGTGARGAIVTILGWFA